MSITIPAKPGRVISIRDTTGKVVGSFGLPGELAQTLIIKCVPQ